MMSTLQASIMGIPILFVVLENPVPFYLVLTFMVFLICVATLLLIFAPKIVLTQAFMQLAETEQRQVILASIRRSSQAVSNPNRSRYLFNSSDDDLDNCGLSLFNSDDDLRSIARSYSRDNASSSMFSPPTRDNASSTKLSPPSPMDEEGGRTSPSSVVGRSPPKPSVSFMCQKPDNSVLNRPLESCRLVISSLTSAEIDKVKEELMEEKTDDAICVCRHRHQATLSLEEKCQDSDGYIVEPEKFTVLGKSHDGTSAEVDV